MNSLAVLIPVYRNQSGLDRSLASLREADCGFDVVVVDDGSPDPIRTPSRLRFDMPVTLLRLDKNRGIAGALNHGLGHILARKYDYVGRLDSGDTVAPERFVRQARFLDANPKCAVVSSFVDFVDSNQRLLFRYRAPSQHSKIIRRLHVNNCVMHPAATVRASALRDAGVYSEDAPGAEDYELFLRMATRHKLAILPEVLTRTEYSFTGLSIAGRRRQQRERLRLQLRYFDFVSPYSFYGVGCTLLTMLLPHSAAFRLKRAYLR